MLSGVGAAISMWQSYKAKSYRDEIVVDRSRIALIDVLGDLRAARDECKKIMTPVGGKAMRGVDPSQVIRSIQACAEKLNENEHRLSSADIKELLKGLSEYLTIFAANQDALNRQKTADEIYACLNQLVAQVARQIDDIV